MGDSMRTLDTRPMLTVEQIAEQFGVDITTVRRWINDGLLPAVQLGGHSRGPIRVRPSALDQTLSRWEVRNR